MAAAKKEGNVEALVRLLSSEPLYATIKVSSLAFESTKMGFGVGPRVWLKVPPTIRVEVFCPTCEDSRPFAPAEAHWPKKEPGGWNLQIGYPLLLVFTCGSCVKQRAVFALETQLEQFDGIVQKVGQAPGQSARLSPTLAKAMGRYAGLFRKGLTSEFHGFGVGAYAYYRQVAENLVESLLRRLRAEAEVLQHKDLIDTIDGLAPTARASEKIGIVKDHLPPSLKPHGVNPLGAIYKALSEGIHAGTDEECLQEAKALRGALTFVVQQLAENKERREMFLSDVRELSAQKGQPSTSDTVSGTEAVPAKTGT